MKRLAPFLVLGAFLLASPGCKKAKDYARRLYKTDGRDEPPRFTCQSGSNFDEGGACHHDSKDKYFGWHPADKRKQAGR